MPPPARFGADPLGSAVTPESIDRAVPDELGRAAARGSSVARAGTGVETEAAGTLPFGPYAGQGIEAVAVMDPGYLLGLVAEGVGPAALRAEAARALALRGRIPHDPAPAARRRPSRPLPPRPWALGAIAGVLVLLLMGAGRAGWRAPGPAAGSGGTGAAPTSALAGKPASRASAEAPGGSTGRGAGAGGPAEERGKAAAGKSPTLPAAGLPVAGLTADAPSGTAAPCGARVPGAIPAELAGDYLDSFQAVEMTVVKTKDTGRVTFLNSHEPYAGHFYVAIFPGDYERFPEPPAGYFRGRCIVVQGMIELYRGAPQIVLRDPGDVRIVGP